METLTPEQKKELIQINTANSGRLVKSLPCGMTSAGKKRFKIEVAPITRKSQNIQGQPILTPIFDDQLSSIKWALETGFSVSFLKTILETM